MTDLKLWRGDNTTLQVYVYRHNENTGLDEPVLPSLSWFTAKKNSRDLDTDAVIYYNSQDNPSKVQNGNGWIMVNLSSADTAVYSDHWLLYDIQVQESNGIISTIEHGFIEFKGDITRVIIPGGGGTGERIPPGGNVGDVLRRSGVSQLAWTAPPVVTSGTWKYSTSVVAGDPGNGRFRLDNSPEIAQNLYISNLDAAGVDVTTSFNWVRSGHGLRIEDSNDSSIWTRYIVATPPANNGAWSTIALSDLTWNSKPFLSNNDCLLVFQFDALASVM